jgi:hypothetical protein
VADALDGVLGDLEVGIVTVLGQEAANLGTMILAQVRLVVQEAKDLADCRVSLAPGTR